MSGIEVFNLLFRFAAVGVQFVIFWRVVADVELRPFKGLFAAFILCTLAYTVVSSGMLFDHHPEVILSLVPFTFPITWLFWMSTHALFEDDFSARPLHWVLLAAILTVSCTEFYFSVQAWAPIGGFLPAVNDIVSLVLVAHALYVAWRGREGDLLEARRSFRLMFVGGVGVLIAIIVSTELSFVVLAVDSPSMALTLLAAVSIWAIVTLLALQLLSLRSDSLLAALATPAVAAPSDGIAPEDRALYDKLQKAMEQDEAFRTEGLTIGALAETLGAPEHQLRKLINQAMGYKNFNAYLNKYRLAAAKAQLADIAQARTQVLTIALEAGYASLGPFNRAFKEATGKTPTEFRKQALARTASLETMQ